MQRLSNEYRALQKQAILNCTRHRTDFSHTATGHPRHVWLVPIPRAKRNHDLKRRQPLSTFPAAMKSAGRAMRKDGISVKTGSYCVTSLQKNK